MKTKIAFIVIWVFFLSILSLSSGEKKPPQLSEKRMLPDLTVKLEIKTKKYPDSYSVTPRYIVTNNGMSVARNFKVVLWHLYRSSPKARIKAVLWSSNTVRSLGSKMSWTFDYNPINTTSWSSKKGGQVGFRVFADADDNVAELKEDNNKIQKFWPPILRYIKTKTLKKP